MKRGMRLRERLTATYLLVLLVPLILFWLYASATARDAVLDNARRTLAENVEHANLTMALKMEQMEKMMSFVAYNTTLQDIYRNDFNSYYQLYRSLIDIMSPILSGLVGGIDGDVSELLVYSNRGLETFGSFIRSANAIKDEEWYARTLDEPNLLWSLSGDEMFVACRINALLAPGEVYGVARMDFRTEAFFAQYASLQWSDYRLSVLNANGETLYSRTFGSASAGDSERLELGFDLDAQGWRFRYSIPRDSMAWESPNVRLALTIVGISAALMLIVIALFTRTITKGILRLRRDMERVSEGEMDLVVRGETNDEIGELTNAFGDMLIKTRELLDKVRMDEHMISDLELRSLRAQIDPHFLYNSLSLLHWKAVASGSREIDEIVNWLSVYFRTCLNKGQDLISVKDELANIRAYMDIQRRMHADAFDYSIDADESLLNLRILNFILQPLVENAIVHGIDMKPEGRGVIGVRAERRASILAFTVSDNGPGFATDALASNAAKPNGYGIHNVNQRILLRYGEGYGIRAENRAVGGCMAILRLPYEDR